MRSVRFMRRIKRLFSLAFMPIGPVSISIALIVTGLIGTGPIGTEMFGTSVWAQDRTEDAASGAATIKSDEVVLLFPTAARLDEEAGVWLVPIHGWIHEPETNDLGRSKLIRETQETLQFSARDPRGKILAQRLRLFLVDNERGKRVGVRVGNLSAVMPASGKDGHFWGEMRIAREEAGKHAEGGRLQIRVQLPADDSREFVGHALLIEPEGRSIISDIDDTVKISEVTDKRRLIENTFVEPFRVVPGMNGLYRRWCENGASLHFVSNGPWQLYTPVAAMLRGDSFPEATFHMQQLRLKDASLATLFGDPMARKVEVIEELLRRYPKRRFVCVGDSGEKDPEAYGELARRFPMQVERILIRKVTAEPAEDPRYAEAFRDVPRERWQLFTTPEEIQP